jgi:CarboxypepD_reg-like domain
VQVWVVPANLKTKCDSAGHYRLDAIPAGSAIVRTSLIGYVSAQQTLVLSPGDSVTLNFSVLPRELPDERPVMVVPREPADSR